MSFIRSAQSAGLSLAEIRAVLAIRDHGEPPCAHVTGLLRGHLAETERRLAELTATRTMLRDLLATAGAPGRLINSLAAALSSSYGDDSS